MEFFDWSVKWGGTKSRVHGHFSFEVPASDALLRDAFTVAGTFQFHPSYVLDEMVTLRSTLSDAGDYVVSGAGRETQVLFFPSNEAYEELHKTKKYGGPGSPEAAKASKKMCKCLKLMLTTPGELGKKINFDAIIKVNQNAHALIKLASGE